MTSPKTHATKTRAIFRLTLALLILSVLAPACLSLTQQRRQSLVLDVNQFNDAIRWGRYSDALKKLPPFEAKLFHARLEALGDDLVFADAEIKGIDIGEGTKEATATVEFSWYKQRDPIVRRTVLEQKWKYEAGWQVAKQRRIRGARFPLLPEPLLKPAAGDQHD